MKIVSLVRHLASGKNHHRRQLKKMEKPPAGELSVKEMQNRQNAIAHHEAKARGVQPLKGK